MGATHSRDPYALSHPDLISRPEREKGGPSTFWTAKARDGMKAQGEFLADRIAREWKPNAGPVWKAGGLYIGKGNNGIEIAVANSTAAPRGADLQSAWKKRRAGRATPVLVIVLYPEGAGLCGPSGEHPPVYPQVDPGQIERVCSEVLDQPDRHAALRFLAQALPSLETVLPGLSNEGLLALHELQHGAPTREDWTHAGRKAARALGPRDDALLKALGFRVERLDNLHQPASKRRPSHRARSDAARERVARSRHRTIQQPLSGQLRTREGRHGEPALGHRRARQPPAPVLDRSRRWRRATGTNRDKHAPLDFLDPAERAAVLGADQRFRVSLYKALLFRHVQSAIKSGTLNLEHSYKYRALDDYLIDRQRWAREKEQLLERDGVQDFADPESVLDALDDALHKQYEITNDNIRAGDNPHVQFKNAYSTDAGQSFHLIAVGHSI